MSKDRGPTSGADREAKTPKKPRGLRPKEPPAELVGPRAPEPLGGRPRRGAPLEREELSVQAERVLLVGLRVGRLPAYEAEESLRELAALVGTAGGVVVGQYTQHLGHPVSGTYIGKGKILEIKARVAEGGVDAVAFDNQLTPRQLKNLEQRLECKVLDRTEVILDIFADHAQTHQAKVQVELAQLRYTRGRVRGMWAHLERLGGGIGTRGPGEKQIETDRRLLKKRIEDLEEELAGIEERKAREVAGRTSQAVTIGIVGYTNAGKSTLMNALTDAGVEADDQLFKTLETRTRKWDLGEGIEVLLSDTVGFINNLPHHLVASFHATLEEAARSSLLLNVIDSSHPEAALQMRAVETTLATMGMAGQERVCVFNKIDRLADRSELGQLLLDHPDHVLISARTGVGIGDLVARVRRHVFERLERVTFRLAHGDKRLARVEAVGMQLERRYDQHGALITGHFWPPQLHQLATMGLVPVVEESPSGG